MISGSPRALTKICSSIYYQPTSKSHSEHFFTCLSIDHLDVCASCKSRSRTVTRREIVSSLKVESAGVTSNKLVAPTHIDDTVRTGGPAVCFQVDVE